eukprot:365653-Chlamydomonas_euryale.AAC.3
MALSHVSVNLSPCSRLPKPLHGSLTKSRPLHTHTHTRTHTHTGPPRHLHRGAHHAWCRARGRDRAARPEPGQPPAAGRRRQLQQPPGAGAVPLLCCSIDLWATLGAATACALELRMPQDH